MTKNIRNTLIGVSLTVAVIAILLQGILIYRLQTQVNQLESAAQHAVSPMASNSALDLFDILALQPSSPGTPFSRMQQDMDSLFDSLLQGTATSDNNGFLISRNTPTIEVEESSADYRILIHVPEQGELELSTDVEDRTVTVSGRVVLNQNQSRNHLASSFSSSSKFSRSIELSKPVDPLAMRTERQDDGIIITIPKA